METGMESPGPGDAKEERCSCLDKYYPLCYTEKTTKKEEKT